MQVLERIPGVAAVSPFSYYGGLYKGDEKFTSFAQFAVDPKLCGPLIADAKIAPEQLAAWMADRTSCIVGKMTADRYGLKIGDRMQFTGQFYPVRSGVQDGRHLSRHGGRPEPDVSPKLSRRIAGQSRHRRDVVGAGRVHRGGAAGHGPDQQGLCQHQRRGARGIGARVRARVRLDVGQHQDAHLAGISVVVVFALMLVTVSTMSMAIRERFRELAILKALGFRRRELFAFILAESFGLAMAGAVLGAGGAWVVFRSIDIQTLTNGLFVMFEVTPAHDGPRLRRGVRARVAVRARADARGGATSVVQGLKTLD